MDDSGSGVPALDELRERAVGMLARREHSRRELTLKLRQRGYAEAELEAVIGALAAEGLQSDERFAEQFVRSRRERGQGPMRIRAALAERGVEDAVADAWLDAEPFAYLQAAAMARRKRFGGRRPRDAKDRARQTRFLANRGFTHAQIKQALRGEGDQYDDEE